MKFLILASIAIAMAKADVSFTKDEVMCNCKAPYNTMYVAYQKAASESCKQYPAGSPGQSACIATTLGYLKNDGRTFNHDALTKDFINLPFVASCDPKLPELADTTGSWQWHGNFNYVAFDAALTTYMTCIGQAMESDCNGQLVSKVRSCSSGN